jgi:hypothetical protein
VKARASIAERAKATIAARQSKPLKVRYAGREIEIQAKAGQTYNLGTGLEGILSWRAA